jgi:hypothetical protein
MYKRNPLNRLGTEPFGKFQSIELIKTVLLKESDDIPTDRTFVFAPDQTGN